MIDPSSEKINIKHCQDLCHNTDSRPNEIRNLFSYSKEYFPKDHKIQNCLKMK